MLLFTILTLSIAVPHHEILQLKHFNEFYDLILNERDHIAQLTFYQGLQSLGKRFEDDSVIELENSLLYKEQYEALITLFEESLIQIQSADGSVAQYRKYEMPSEMEKVKRIIGDKEKLIEADVKEIAKLKQSSLDDLAKKIEEFRYLHQHIHEVLDSSQGEDLYKLLELIESKVMIGLFRQPQPVPEVDIFMKGVDKIFREKSQYKIEEVFSLIGVISNIVSEMLLKYENDLLIQQMELLDKTLFYQQSKVTHLQAKQLYVDILSKMDIHQSQFIPNELESTLKESLIKVERINKAINDYYNTMKGSLDVMIKKFTER